MCVCVCVCVREREREREREKEIYFPQKPRDVDSTRSSRNGQEEALSSEYIGKWDSPQGQPGLRRTQ